MSKKTYELYEATETGEKFVDDDFPTWQHAVDFAEDKGLEYFVVYPAGSGSCTYHSWQMTYAEIPSE